MADLYLGVLVSLTVIVVAWLVTRTVGEYYRQKAEVSRRMAMVRRQATSKRSVERVEVADWVKELIEQLGHDPEELYDDEMPDDLAQFLSSPMVKSFIQGISKGGTAEGEGTPQTPGGSPGGGWF